MPIWPTDPPDDYSDPAEPRCHPIGHHGAAPHASQQEPRRDSMGWGEDSANTYTGHPDYEK